MKILVNAGITATYLFLAACGASQPTEVPQPTTPPHLLAPTRTYCPNYEDFVRVQPNGQWQFVDIEGNITVGTVDNLNSYADAISECTTHN